MDVLEEFYKQPADKRYPSRLKFLITSRPYYNIERRFQTLIQEYPEIRLSGEFESVAISSEINLVIKASVLELSRALNLKKSEQSLLETELSRMTNRTYLWIKLIIEVIRDEVSITKKKIRHIVETLPTTAEEAYEAILSRTRVKDKKKVQKLLHIVVAAKRPLTLKEMNIALAIEDHHEKFKDMDLDEETRFSVSVRQLCGLFVSIVDQKIYLIHQTAKEFLIAKDEVSRTSWKHSFDPLESEYILARTCIAYLLLDVFDGEFIDVHTQERSEYREQHSPRSHQRLYSYLDPQDDFEYYAESVSDSDYDSDTIAILEEVYGFFKYSATSWSVHYRKAQPIASNKVLLSVLKLSDPSRQNYRNWIQAYKDDFDIQYITDSSVNTLMVASFLGHETVVKALLTTGNDEVNLQDKGGCTPLFWAAEQGHESVVDCLLATGQVDVNLQSHKNRTALFCAAQYGHEEVVKRLLKSGKAVVDGRDDSGCTPLLYAVKHGHEGVVRCLLTTDRVDVNAKDGTGWNSLLYAARYGYEKIAAHLLSTGKVDVNARGKDGWTALLHATNKGYEGIVRQLLKTGEAKVDVINGFGHTPLSLAARAGNVVIVKELLDTGQVNINLKNKEWRTPLWLAARNGHEMVVWLLLDTGRADVNVKDKYGHTALWWSKCKNFDGVTALLEHYGARTD
jgi:ankyrin repeat protein